MKVFDGRILGLAFVCAVIVCTSTSCRKEEEHAATATDVAVAKVKEEPPPKCDSAEPFGKAVSRKEQFIAEFERLLVCSNMTVSATESAANKLCWEIRKIQDKTEALRLYDQLFEMAMSHDATATDYYSRQNWYCALFYMAGQVFTFSQGLRKDSFEDWDKLFLFFKKYTDEITAVEGSLPSVDYQYWKWADAKKGSYLRGLKGDLKMWVRVIRDFHFPKLSEGLSEEQKADILRRFDEVKKYTEMPPNFRGEKKNAEPRSTVDASDDGSVPPARK